jgi:hypothetical protein
MDTSNSKAESDLFQDQPGKITFRDDLKVLRYTEEELTDFETNTLSKYQLKIPSFLRQTFLTGKNFLEEKFTSSNMEAELDFYAYLTKQQGMENGFEGPNHVIYPSTNIEEILEIHQENQLKPPTKTALAFGGDACGNFFYADESNGSPVVWFGDHESYSDEVENDESENPKGWYKFTIKK